MSLFASCPEQFRQRYLLRRPESNFGDKFMGNVNHELIADMLRMKMNGLWHDFAVLTEDQKKALVRQRYRDFWDQQLERDGEPDWRDQDASEQYTRGLLMGLTYVDKALPQIEPLAVEERVELKLPALPPIIGYVDVIEAGKIRERKTTNKKVTKPTSKWRFQARVYQLILGLPVEWDILTRQAEPQLYTCADFPDLRMEYVSKTNTERLIRDIHLQMQDLWTRRGNHEPWPQTGFFDPWLCQFCSIGPKYGATCGAWS
jgi:hypothetical protein